MTDKQEPVGWTDICGAVARGWRHPENAGNEMDAALALAIAEEVQRLYLAAPPAQPDVRIPTSDIGIAQMTNLTDKFEAWYYEQENSSLRAERMAMSYAEAQAAFEAGWQAAHGSLERELEITKGELEGGDELARLREQEPVAWMEEWRNVRVLSWDKHYDDAVPLYAAPPAQPAPAQRLSDADITSLAYDCNALPEVVTDVTLRIFARAIEAAICPPGYVVVKADFNVTECIHAGYKRHKYAQGTGPGVAFYRGAMWLASTGAAAKDKP